MREPCGSAFLVCLTPRSSVSSDPLGDGGSGVLGLGALSSVKAVTILSSPGDTCSR